MDDEPTPPLIPFQTMATTKAVKAARRARVKATSPQRSETLSGSLNHAGIAAAPAPGLTRSPESCQDQEFHLPDEDRFLKVLWKQPGCLTCGWRPTLERKNKMFRVTCQSKTCYGKESTSWFDSSDAAVYHYKLVQKLSRL